MKNQNIIYLAVGIIFVGIIVAFTVASVSKQEDTIKIGGLFSLTGAWSHGGGTEAKFAQMAIDEINENGGIDGKQMEFILEDVKSSPLAAATAANKLVNVDGVKFILGPDNTPNFQSSISAIDSGEVVSMAFTVTAKDVLEGLNYAVRFSPDSKGAGNLIGKLAAKKYNLTKVAVIIEDTDFDRSWADDMKDAFEKNGGKVALYETYSSDEFDFKTPLLKISGLDIDGLYFSGRSQAGMGNAVRQMNELNILDNVTLFGNAMIIDPEVYRASGNSIPETAFSVEVYSRNSELLEKYASRYSEQPGFIFFYSAAPYDAVYMLKDAIVFCGENSRCVRDYFTENINGWEGQVATWSFNEKGEPVLPLTSYKEVRIVDGKKSYEDVII